MNAVAEFASLPEALAYVREEVAQYGSDATATWMLLHDAGHGDMERVAYGGVLAHLAADPATSPTNAMEPVELPASSALRNGGGSS